MRAYVAAPPSRQQIDAMNAVGYRWALSSFALDRKCRVGEWATAAEHFLFDSGAFTVWTKNASVAIEDYIEWAYEARAIVGPERCAFLNLDVIPGTHAGGPASAAEKDAAVAESAENAAWLRASGLEVIEVYHYGEPVAALEAIIERSRGGLISLGGLAGRTPARSEKERWCAAVFGYLRDRFGWEAFPAVHGLGVSPDSPLSTRFPWWSVDSSSWNIWHRYGAEVTRDGRRQKSVARQMADGRAITSLRPAGDIYFARTLRRWQRIEATLTRLWQERGVRIVMREEATHGA